MATSQVTDMFTFIKSMGLNKDQLTVLVEYVVLLDHHGSIDEKWFLKIYQQTYHKSLSCFELGVKSMKQYFEKIDGVICTSVTSKRSMLCLTELGKILANSIIDRSKSGCGLVETAASALASVTMGTSSSQDLSHVYQSVPVSNPPVQASAPPLFGINVAAIPVPSKTTASAQDFSVNAFAAAVQATLSKPALQPPQALQSNPFASALGFRASPQRPQQVQMSPVKNEWAAAMKSKTYPVDVQPTPLGGEPFLLENEFPELSSNPKNVSREHLEAMIIKNIETIAEQGEFASPRNVELMLCRQLGISSIRDLDCRRLRLRRGLDDLEPMRQLSRKIGQVEAHITSAVALRNVNTLSDLLEGMREGIPDKKSYESLKLGPITRLPAVQQLFGLPSGCEVVDISCTDVYERLRTYVSRNDLWKSHVKVDEFMKFLTEEYGVEDVFTLGVMIRSIPLCMQNIKRAQRQERDAVKNYYESIAQKCAQDLDSVYKSFRMKIMIESDDGYSAKLHYLSQTPHEVVRDVLNKFQHLLETLQDMGLQDCQKDTVAIKQLKKAIEGRKLIQELFKFSVVCSSNEVVSSVDTFLEKMLCEKQEEKLQKEKLEKVRKDLLIQRLVDYMMSVVDSGLALNLRVLRDIEVKCAKHFKRENFVDLGHEPFLEFLLKNEKTSRILEESGSMSSGGVSKKVYSLYRPSLNDVVEVVMNVDGLTESKLEEVACFHYKVGKYNELGLGSIKTVIGRVEKLRDKHRNVVYEPGFCSQASVIKFRYSKVGILGHVALSNALKSLQECPLLEDLEMWSQWNLIYAQQFGPLKDFVEKYGGSGHFKVEDKDIAKDLTACEIEPGKLLRLTSETSDDIFRNVVDEGDPRKISGHLVSLVVSRGFKSAGLALLSNVISAHLHKLGATSPGAPPCSSSQRPAIVFTRDCLNILPLMFCELLADEVFLKPCSRLFGQSESKRLLAKSCENFQQMNRFLALGHLIGVDQWQNLSWAEYSRKAATMETRQIETGSVESSDEDVDEEDWGTDSDDDFEDVKTEEKEESTQPMKSVSEMPGEINKEHSTLMDNNEKEAHAINDVMHGREETDVDDNESKDVGSDDEETLTGAKCDVSTANQIEIVKGVDGNSSPPSDQTSSAIDAPDFSVSMKNESHDHEAGDKSLTDDLDRLTIDDEDGSANSSADQSEEESEDDDGLDLSPEERLCKKTIDSIRRDEFGCGVELEETARGLVQKQQDKLKRSLQRLSQDLYTKDTHFVLELVQNADDNTYGSEQKCPSMEFVIDKDQITILNNEVGFEERNVRALCDVGNSTKPKHKYGYIGQKGIGFKSVFRVTDRPEIHSNGYHFCFNMQEDEIGYILPNWIEDGVENQLRYSNWQTRIVLPLKLEMRRSISSLTNRFRDIHPSLLLFLHRLKSINIENRIEGTKTKMIRRDLGKKITEIKHNKKIEKWLVNRKRLDVSKLNIQIKGGVDVQETEIALAFPIRDVNKAPEKQSVFAFLPLRGYGFRFVIQADFDLPSSREDLDCDSAWNQWLRKEIAPTFVEALTSFRDMNPENPILAVKHFLMFVASEDEIMEFFKPVATEILRQLSSTEFLPTEAGDLKLPCQLVMGADSLLRRTFPNSMLDKYLNLSYIHPDLLSDQNRELLLRLGVNSLRTSDILGMIQARSVAWHTEGSKPDLEEIARMLVCVQRNLNDLDMEDKTLDSLRKLNIIPDKSGELVALKEQAVFFPLPDSGKKYSNTLPGDINIVHPQLINALEKVQASQVVDILEKMGVKHITAKEVIQSHILPIFSSERWKLKPRELIKDYVVFLHAFESDLSEVINFKDLREVIQLSTNHGLKNPSKEFIHFTKEHYKNSVNLPKVFPEYKWCMLDYYPGYDRDSWRRFFLKLGVIDMFGVKKSVKKFSPAEFEETIWKKSLTRVNQSFEFVEVTDWHSEEIETLISKRSMDNYEQMQDLFEQLAMQYETMSKMDYFEARLDTHVPGIPPVTSPSSLAHYLQSTPWLPGLKENFENGRPLKNCDFYLARDLYSPAGDCSVLLKFHVPYIDIGKFDPRNNRKIFLFLGVRDRIECAELKEFFLQWTEGEFTTTRDHMSVVYTYFNSCMTGFEFVELLTKNKAFFIPEKTCGSLVSGHFCALNEVCWCDHGDMFAKYKEEVKSNLNVSVKTLSQFDYVYGRDKFHGVVNYMPDVKMYIELLEVVCTYFPKCSDRFQDVVYIYGVIIDEMKKRRPEEQDTLLKSFEKRRVIPTKENVYVSLADIPMIADHERLEKLFTGSKGVHFIDLFPGQKRGKGQLQKPDILVQQLQNFLIEVLKVKPLSECVKEDIVTEGFQSFPPLQNYFHCIVESLQKLILKDHESTNELLAEKNIGDILKKLKFISVGKLEAVYRLDRPEVTKVENRECHIVERDRIVYVHKDYMDDDRCMQKAIAEFFSCGDNYVSSQIQVFLMTMFPSIKNPKVNVKKSNPDYVFKNLPKEVEKWLVEEVIERKVETKPPVPEVVKEETEAVLPESNQTGSDNVLRCWPPPAPGYGSGGSRNVTPGETSWPKPHKPDIVSDELPEKLRMMTRAPRMDSERPPRLDRDSSSSNSTSKEETELKETTHVKSSELKTIFVAQDDAKPRTVPANSDAKQNQSAIRQNDSSVRPKTESAGTGPRQYDCSDKIRESEETQKGITSASKLSENKTPAESLASAPESDIPKEANIAVGPLPITSSPPRDKVPSSQGGVQSVRRFDPDEIDDIPNERVSYACGNVADVSSLVEIHLGAASTQTEIGRHGESLVYKYLCARIGQPYGEISEPEDSEIIKSVTWVNEVKESGLPYDLKLITTKQKTGEDIEYSIEVKSTMSDSKMYFETSANELTFAGSNGDKYDLYRVFSVGNKDRVKLVKLRNVSKALEDKSIRVFMVV